MKYNPLHCEWIVRSVTDGVSNWCQPAEGGIRLIAQLSSGCEDDGITAPNDYLNEAETRDLIAGIGMMTGYFSSVIILLSDSNLALFTQARTDVGKATAVDRLTESVVCMHGHGAIVLPLDTFMNRFEITYSEDETAMVRKHALFSEWNVEAMHMMMQALDHIGNLPMTTQRSQWVQMVHANNALPKESTWDRILPGGYVRTQEGTPTTAACPFLAEHKLLSSKGVSIERHKVLDKVVAAVYGDFGNQTLIIACPYTLQPTFAMEHHDPSTNELINNIGPDMAAWWVGFQNKTHLHRDLLPAKAQGEVPSLETT